MYSEDSYQSVNYYSPGLACSKRHLITSFVNKAITVITLNIGTPRPATVVVLNIKQFNFTLKLCLQKM